MAIGGLLRLAPEALKWLDRKDARTHELAMQELQFRIAAANAEAQMRQLDAEIGMGELNALVEGVRAQAQSGVKWADALSATVRPVITYALFTLWGVHLYTSGWAWGPMAESLLGSILGYWFLDRSLRRR